jgi:hypothetical protein
MLKAEGWETSVNTYHTIMRHLLEDESTWSLPREPKMVKHVFILSDD